MKLAIQFPDLGGHTDGPVFNLILKHLNATCQIYPDAVIVPCVWHPGFTFNSGLRRITEPIILIDMLEFGWNYGDKENRLGHGTEQWPEHLKSAEWDKLDAWVREQPPRLTLKRELWQRDVTETMKPIDFPCSIPLPPVQSKAEFDARKIEVFHCWGLSNPSRPRLHGDIFKNAHENGINFVDSFALDNHFEGRTWATIYTPYFNRVPMTEVMRWQQRSKISVSLPGAGQKCFRSSEATVGSIMALQEDEMAWAFPWMDAKNCITLIPSKEFYVLEFETKRADLYDIYRASQETAAKYQAERYAREYVLPTIEACL